ncbi:MAG: cytochrome c biogenesis protein CcdA [Hyphomicrobium sp.]|nr:cytochrome c biogenesis protein CcdA [Hyphomicrobium sp.]
MDGATIALAFLAGVLSILSPCVLPLVPIVLATAAAEHRSGPVALAAGLAVSFTAIGLFVATIGYAIGLDGDLFRLLGALLLGGLGLLLLLPAAQAQLAAAGGPAGNWIESRLGRFSTSGLIGQAMLGVLLGAVWAPCVGPTLGAASVLAARGENLGSVALTMATFGIGAALPLLALGLISRDVMMRWRGRLLGIGRGAKAGLGLLLLAAAIMVASGLDKRVEAALVEISPAWLTDLTTRY